MLRYKDYLPENSGFYSKEAFWHGFSQIRAGWNFKCE